MSRPVSPSITMGIVATNSPANSDGVRDTIIQEASPARCPRHRLYTFPDTISQRQLYSSVPCALLPYALGLLIVIAFLGSAAVGF
ncbi:hypothetical protein K461DRAFT_175657 [Myriangium duriaei CBS 260.36]|uniref:Uncharacterized protein n=1 Tax=Myriangium duriaei CBS 260.36 TaxID=1168546 RepID=A0A9P4MEV4_9PEZI|nr:hypothetical protein K461DRAFT_175657 [Myriangium duriaei CBS 260.36]